MLENPFYNKLLFLSSNRLLLNLTVERHEMFDAPSLKGHFGPNLTTSKPLAPL